MGPSIRRFLSKAGVHLAALTAYAVLAVVFSWPLPVRMGTHITGSPDSDAGAYVWNQWVFRREAAAGHPWAFKTAEILSLTDEADLSLHNYTVFADLMSLPLQGRFGVVTSFNLVLLALQTLTAYAMFLLARSVVGSLPESLLAGMLFGFSPFLSARSTAHYSLVAAAPLPVFLLCLRCALRSGHWAWGIAAGAVMAWSAYCDPYYLVFCYLMLAVALASTFVTLTAARRTPPPAAGTRRALDAVVLLCAVLVLTIAVTGGGQLRVGGLGINARTLYTPVLLLMGAVAARLLAAWRVRAELSRQPSAALTRLIAAGLVSAVALLAPLLVALGHRAREGRLAPPTLWRSSPPGIDLLAFLMPNANHPLFGEPFRMWLSRLRSDGFVENTASLTLTALAIVACAAWARLRLPRAWIGFTVFFAALALGPFVNIGGVNTCIPTPWTVLRFVPGIGLARAPARFAVVAMLGFTILTAAALKELGARWPSARAALLGGTAVLLAFELSPAPRTLFAADVPAVFDVIARDPCPVRVLELPMGVRDGTSSIGDFTARSQFFQTRHCKPILGGYLSRVSANKERAYRKSTMMNVLLKLSANEAVTPEEGDGAREVAAAFVQRSHIGFVVIDHSRTSRKLFRFVSGAFDLQPIAQDGTYELLVPRASVCGPDGGASCSHTGPGCAFRAGGGKDAPAAPLGLVAVAGPRER